MAKSNDNVITHGLSGLIGKLLVFRQKAGKTVVANRPRKTTHQPNATSLAIREKFKVASRYAKNAISDLAVKAAYQAKAILGQSAFNVAFSDYMKGPEFGAVPVYDHYTGEAGTPITIEVIDNFKVASVDFSIVDATDNELEAGSALAQEGSFYWSYETQVNQSSLSGAKVRITAKDLPGNQETLEVSL